ncbi:conserved hypothetical protein [Saccharomyces cerevisiae RM11-1a]|uniref:Uncharacterized protein n=1 Tax=Saccharomyces cerevisiae (strain RM11-1a) TaxID=285006 RepID=B3LL74_YEAS1|nr:conserved hypothetical protein [Saccharomyces cerevisiae RM11-1a]
MLIIGTEVSQNSDTQLLLNGKKKPRKGYRDLAHAFFSKRALRKVAQRDCHRKKKSKPITTRPKVMVGSYYKVGSAYLKKINN